MAFFKKLKDRLFKSSSKIDEGLEAIVSDGGEAEADVLPVDEVMDAPAQAVEEMPEAVEPDPAEEARLREEREAAEQAARQAEEKRKADEQRRADEAKAAAKAVEDARVKADAAKQAQVAAEAAEEDERRKAAEAAQAAQAAYGLGLCEAALELTSVPVAVWMDGRATSLRSRQTELRDRYLRPAGALPRAYPAR